MKFTPKCFGENQLKIRIAITAKSKQEWKKRELKENLKHKYERMESHEEKKKRIVEEKKEENAKDKNEMEKKKKLPETPTLPLFPCPLWPGVVIHVWISSFF